MPPPWLYAQIKRELVLRMTQYLLDGADFDEALIRAEADMQHAIEMKFASKEAAVKRFLGQKMH